MRQELTPDRLRGRVASVHALIEHGTAAPGALLGGFLATRFDLVAPFWFGAIAGALLIPLTWSAFSEESVRSARRVAAIETG